MKLYYSVTSPYVRKVMACAIVRGIEGRIDKLVTNPHESPAALIADNPLSRVPCLVTEDGFALFDSPVICEYLDTLGDAAPMFPPSGAARWVALRLQALGDGMLDASVLRRQEQMRPREDARDAVMARQKAAIDRSLALLEREVPTRHLDIGSITIACALGYLDLRFAEENWRGSHPHLAEWYAQMMKEKALAETRPD